MATTFLLEIFSCDRIFYKGMAEEIIFPSLDGLQGILADHEPMISALVAGELKFLVDGNWRYAAVSDGFVEITQEHVTLLADTVEAPEEIDINRAQEAKLRAEERLRQKESIREYYHTQAALSRAMARLGVTSKHI